MVPGKRGTVPGLIPVPLLCFIAAALLVWFLLALLVGQDLLLPSPVRVLETLGALGLDLLGIIPDFKETINDEEYENSLKTIYQRLNLPQG